MRPPVWPDVIERGEMIAVFPDGYSARMFYDRLAANPAGEYAVADSVKLNRRGGRVVTWRLDMEAIADHARRLDVDWSLGQYVRDMAETVGHYGTTPAGWAKLRGLRTPDGSRSDTVAWLNKVPCPPEY